MYDVCVEGVVLIPHVSLSYGFADEGSEGAHVLGHGVGAVAELPEMGVEATEEVGGEVAEGEVRAYFFYLPDCGHHVLLGGGAA